MTSSFAAPCVYHGVDGVGAPVSETARLGGARVCLGSRGSAAIRRPRSRRRRAKRGAARAPPDHRRAAPDDDPSTTPPGLSRGRHAGLGPLERAGWKQPHLGWNNPTCAEQPTTPNNPTWVEPRKARGAGPPWSAQGAASLLHDGAQADWGPRQGAYRARERIASILGRAVRTHRCMRVATRSAVSLR